MKKDTEYGIDTDLKKTENKSKGKGYCYGKKRIFM